MMKTWVVLAGFLFVFLGFLVFTPKVKAIANPLSTPNNKFGIHIISAIPQEASEAADLVNSSGGDWGYITVLIENRDRNQGKWQTFFEELRRRHLIPLVRIATHPEQSFWIRPTDGEENIWADFLSHLNWPTKNRYVIVYNEPNHAKEWGDSVDPVSYARTLDKTITALKTKSEDFFVLNAGFDASAPSKPPNFEDQLKYMQAMNQAVPGIFNKLDGWVSHSYPNPGFVASPNDSGRGSIRNFEWELSVLADLGVTKQLPVFITETGWRHSEGKIYDKSLLPPETVAQYFKEAFNSAWSSSQVVAVTPFLLNYQDYPFDHFSFKKITGDPQNQKILGVQYPLFHPQYQAVADLPKVSGKPLQENKAKLIEGEIYHSVVAGESYAIPLKFKNIGQSIWNDSGPVRLSVIEGQALGIKDIQIPSQIKIEPQQEHPFLVSFVAPKSGTYTVKLNLFVDNKEFDSLPVEFKVEVKSPVILKVRANLQWKDRSDGEYSLLLNTSTGARIDRIALNSLGESEPIEARFLLPDYIFDFTLQRPFYKPKTIKALTVSGVTELDFGTLEPDLPSALLHPIQLWNLLPFSN